MSGSRNTGIASSSVMNSAGQTPFESDRTRSPRLASFAARNSTRVSLPNSDGWNDSARKPIQRRAPPLAKPTCGIMVSTSSKNVTMTAAGAIVRSLR
jgi:hypothetical protein